jgi:hypothetical protein
MSEIVAAIVAVATVYLAWRQLDLMVRQDEFLFRRAKLSIVAERVASPNTGGARRYYEVLVYNAGNRGSAGFYFNMMFDSSEVGAVDMTSGQGKEQPDQTLIVMARTFQIYRMFHETPAYPRRSVLVARFSFEPKHNGPVKVYWQLSAEDGVFPERPVPGGITVDDDHMAVSTLD